LTPGSTSKSSDFDSKAFRLWGTQTTTWKILTLNSWTMITADQAEVQKKVPPGMLRVTRVRSLVTLALFAIAMVVSLKFPFWGFGLVS
jgi:hypothetical protein